MTRLQENLHYTAAPIRISEEEHRHLKNLMEQPQRSVSHIMREAIEYFAADREDISPNRTAV